MVKEDISEIVEAWDVLAEDTRKREGMPLEEARNHVIINCLATGNTKPFSNWVQRGHRPSPGIVSAIAIMMDRANDPQFTVEKTCNPELAARLPFGLHIKREGPGRPFDMEVDILQAIAGRESSKLMDHGKDGKSRMKGFDADSEVMNWLKDEHGLHYSVQWVEAGRKRHRRRGKK